VTLDPSIEVLRRELARGRGALIVTAHLGNWELLCARLRRLGLDGAVVGYERPRDESARWLAAMRRAYGVQTLSQQTSAREILRVLQGGLVVGLLADLEDRRIDGEFLPFFGVPALTMTAPAALARAARLPLIPVRCTVEDGGHYRLAVETPLALDPTLARREATLHLSARLNAVFERWIRETPEQWAWHQARWRTRPVPEGAPLDTPTRGDSTVLIHS
jgi:KDO2-lipid IV(A) lauroyltransferase